MHALIDPGSTHSYVCMEHVFDKVPAMEKLAYDMHVTSPLGHNVMSNVIAAMHARRFIRKGYEAFLALREVELMRK